MTRWVQGLLWCAIGTPALIAAAEFDPDVYFERDWFTIELLVFAYPRPADATPPFLAIERERDAFTIPVDGLSLTRDAAELETIQRAADDVAARLDDRFLDPRSASRSLREPGRGIGSHDGYGKLVFPTWLWSPAPFRAWREPPREGQGIDLDQPAYFDTSQFPPLPSLEPADVAEPTDRELLGIAANRFESSLTALQFRPERVDGLRRAERNVGRRFKILFAGRWLQAVPPRGTPEPILLDQRHEGERLLGHVTFTLSRYLHLDAHLVRFFDDGAHAILAESRRMRSDEVHYLDHPALGIVVRIDRLDVPQVLEDLAFRVNNGAE